MSGLSPTPSEANTDAGPEFRGREGPGPPPQWIRARAMLPVAILASCVAGCVVLVNSIQAII